eukprot:TRINITY_DN2494_c0_g1_i4.p2 TRINITY_DN2494_c0_g1~~TRINITY_DN2494_c0_g1_i4.p2  ORF type:complete len:100 (+),score=10.81 TRINITY_DN2494_c0_g1_i4:360-659(+)
MVQKRENGASLSRGRCKRNQASEVEDLSIHRAIIAASPSNSNISQLRRDEVDVKTEIKVAVKQELKHLALSGRQKTRSQKIVNFIFITGPFYLSLFYFD